MVQAGINGCVSRCFGTYEDAIKTLNSLQSNAAYLRNVQKHDSKSNDTLEQTRKYILRSGLSPERLDDLSVIHVAGTKGKGSACAFAESLLRAHGVKTGLYTSPHLVSVRERLRINGKPIDEDKFTKYFWQLYETLVSRREYESDMPPYFKFITLLMFHVFTEEPIDVAIIEVGIGGEHDCTNIVRNPVCVGITSLGLDHTYLLGDTLQEIAYQKSGIFKKATVAFTVPQPKEAMRILKMRAIEKNCELRTVASLNEYSWPGGTPKLGISSDCQDYNASIALDMARTWIARSKETKKLRPFALDTAAAALSSCEWPGRTQILRATDVDFYLDGAHTLESMHCCARWFAESTEDAAGKRILIFNTTGKRDSASLMAILRSLNFDVVYFVPNIAGKIVTADQINYNVTDDEQMERCLRHRDIWGRNAICADSVGRAFDLIKNEVNSPNGRMQILITGSFHLVGAALAILDPELTMSTDFKIYH